MDTVDIITAATGVNATLLHLNNPQIDEAFNNIYVGQVLCASETVAVPPAAGAVTAPVAEAEDEDDLPWCDEEGGDEL